MEVVVKLGTITAGQSGKLVNFGMDWVCCTLLILYCCKKNNYIFI
jgi:hypothetical protein